ncbi:MAG TPA: UBP-type zinc finger domain-containing protein [Candidatus Saccharimonadales bacterium]|nr:UBP-type zinc finger domain-containing protein [Candidatus Saccharimonadales bacterium]
MAKKQKLIYKSRRWSASLVRSLIVAGVGLAGTIALVVSHAATSSVQMSQTVKTSCTSPEVDISAWMTGEATTPGQYNVSGTLSVVNGTYNLNFVANQYESWNSSGHYHGYVFHLTSIPGFSASQTYTLAISAYNVDKNGNQTGGRAYAQVTVYPATGCTPSTPASPPTLSGSANGQTSASLSWTAGNAGTGNSINYYAVYVDGSAYTNSMGQSATIGGLSCGTSHSYSVRMVTSGGTYASNTISITQSACTAPPPTPTPTGSVTLTGFTINGTTANLAWSTSGNISQIGIRLHPSDGSGDITDSAGGGKFSDTLTVKCGKTYTAQLVATISGGGSTSSNTRSAGSSSCGGTTPPPVNPPPTVKAPKVSLKSLTANGKTSATAKWSLSPSSVTTLKAYIKINAGSYVSHTLSGKATSYQFAASCSNSYTFYVRATNSKGSDTSAKKTVKMPSCFTGSKGGGGSSGGGSSSPSKPTSKPKLPNKPADFTATVAADKIILLGWHASTASAGIQQYEIDRSTDNKKWDLLINTATTSYEDDSASYSTTYYYRVKALDNDNHSSGYSTAMVTTGVFTGSASTITSDDKLATIQIPSDVFTQKVDCTVTVDKSSSLSLPNQQVLLTGPYNLLCVGEDNSIINQFTEPLHVTLNLASVAKGYTNITARSISDGNYTIIKSTLDPKTNHLTFDINNTNAFAVFGVKHKSSGGVIFKVISWLLLLGAVVVGIVFIRRKMLQANPMVTSSGAMMAAAPVAADMSGQPMAAAAPVSHPNCAHLNEVNPALQPQSNGCQECLATGQQWTALRICLTCGHVGCSDDSTGHHARQHFEQTGHPLIMAFGDPNATNVGWCYIDKTYI